MPSKLSRENASIFAKRTLQTIIAMKKKHCSTRQLANLAVRSWGMKDKKSHLQVRDRKGAA
jgi:hypothetical protein